MNKTNRVNRLIGLSFIIFMFCGVAVNAAETIRSVINNCPAPIIQNNTLFTYSDSIQETALLLETKGDLSDPGTEYYNKDSTLFVNLYSLPIVKITVTSEPKLFQAIPAQTPEQGWEPFLLPTPEGETFKVYCSDDKKQYILLTTFDYPLPDVPGADVMSDYKATLVDEQAQKQTPLANIVVQKPDTLAAGYAFCDGKNHFFYFTGSNSAHRKTRKQGVFAYNLKTNTITAVELNNKDLQNWTEAFSPMEVPGTDYYIYIRQKSRAQNNNYSQIWLNKKLKQPVSK